MSLNKLLIFIFLSISFFQTYGQNIMVIENDTIVSLTLDEVRVINSVFLERNYLQEKSQINDSIISYQINVIENLNDIIDSKESIINAQSTLISNKNLLIQDQVSQIDKLKKQRKWILSGGGVILLSYLFLII